MSNNHHTRSTSAEVQVQRGATPSPVAEELPAAAPPARAAAPAKPSWLDNGFIGSRRTTNRDVLVEGTLLVGTIVVATAAAYATAYALQKLFGVDQVADAALVGGDAISL